MKNTVTIVILCLAGYLAWNSINSVEGMVWVYALSLLGLGGIKFLEHHDAKSTEYQIAKDRYLVAQVGLTIIIASLTILFFGRAISS